MTGEDRIDPVQYGLRKYNGAMEKFITETKLQPVEFDPFAGPVVVRTAPTTEPQREVWTASWIDPGSSCSYNESISLRLSGPLDIGVLQRAVDRLVERHEGLRSVFNASGTRSIVLADLPVRVELEDLSALRGEAREQRVREVARALMTKPFDLKNGPLFRVIVFRHGPQEHVLRLVGHHIVCDGWSISVMIGDLSIIYSALVRGSDPELPDACPYSLYAEALNAHYGSEEDQRVTAYWKDLFHGPLPRLELPTDRPRPAEKTWNADRIDIEMPPDLVAGLKRTGVRFGSSFVTTLLSVYEVLLARTTGQRDIVVGLPAAGQSETGQHHLVGHCVSLLPMRSVIDDTLPFSTYLDHRRKAVLDAFDNQRFTLGTLLRELNVERVPGRSPLVPVVFNYDVEMAERVAFANIAHSFHSDPRAFEQFEMAMNASSTGGRLVLEWTYNTDLFDADTVRDWMRQLVLVAEAVIADPMATIAELIATGTEQAPFPSAAWAGTDVAIPVDATVARAFEETALRYPDNIAVAHGDERTTYADLKRRVDRLAGHLAAIGLVPGKPVALCAEPGPGLITGLLAIVRAGGAFVPIDKDLPEQRIAHLLRDCQADILVTEGALTKRFAGHARQTVDIGAPLPDTPPPPFHGGSNDPVYVIYTSGSTGQPKGTVVPHRGVLRTVRGQDFAPHGPDLVFLLHLSISFDACQLSVMGALLNGGTLVVPSQASPSLGDLAATIQRYGVNSMATAGAYFNLLIDEHLPALKGMRHLMTGGDAISVPHVRKAFRELGPGVVVNAYGPTENSMLCTYFPVMVEPAPDRPLPIGKAIRGTTLHVLNGAGLPVRIGEQGELHTGGAGVALGYQGLPDQTAERFIPDPFSDRPNALLYRTGDLVRWLPDGNLEFIGRVDEQVKVRGFRIEPGEVENTLNDLPVVRDRVVVARSDQSGNKRLVCYLVPADVNAVSDEGTRGALCETAREHLRARLPEHMVPADFVVLDALPCTPNGKVDRKALPAPAPPAARMRAEHVAPRSATERALATIWSKVLNVKDPGVHDDFFELGGHSIVGIQMLAKVEREWGRKLPLNVLFRSPTVAGLASVLDSEEERRELEYMAVMQDKGDLPPLICVQGDDANHFLPKYLGDMQPFYAYFHQGEDGHPMPHVEVGDVAANYIRELKQVRPHGPYTLSGLSFGGLVAYEMALQLTRNGDAVPLLILLDTYAPSIHDDQLTLFERLYGSLKKVVLRRVVRWYHDRGRPLPLRIRRFHIIDTYEQATERYAPEPYEGRFMMVKAIDSPGPDHMGWKDLAKGGLKVVTCPGDHNTLVREPNVRILATLMSEGIRESLAHATAEAG